MQGGGPVGKKNLISLISAWDQFELGETQVMHNKLNWFSFVQREKEHNPSASSSKSLCFFA
jgi:hypothetical protein